MKFIFFPVLLFFYFVSCKGQNQDKITLTITNRSSEPIDSIIVPYNKMSILTQIKHNESKKITIDVSNFKIYSEGVLGLLIYQNGKKNVATWGFHDLGRFGRTEENIFIFKNGVNYKDENLQKPEILRIYLTNKSGSPIDSVIAEGNTLVRQLHHSMLTIKIELNYELFQKAPNLKVIQKGKTYLLNISHDWEDWNENSNQETVYLYKNGVISKYEK